MHASLIKNAAGAALAAVPARLTGRHTTLRLLRPLLLALPLLLAVALFCLELMATSGAMLRSHGRWAHAASEAVHTLDLYGRSCDRRFLVRHAAALDVIRAYTEVQAHLHQVPPDVTSATEAFDRADPNPLATDRRVREWRLRMTRQTSNFAAMARVEREWADAGLLARSIESLSARLVQDVATHGCSDLQAREPQLVALGTLERRMDPQMASFGDAVVASNRTVHGVLRSVLLLTCAVMLVLGMALARRTARANRRAALALEAELAARSQAVAALRQVMADLDNTLDAGPAASASTAADVDDVLRKVRCLAERQRVDHAALQAIFARSPDAFVSFGASGRVDFVSPAFEGLTGMPPASVSGCDALTLLTLLGGDRGTGLRLQAPTPDGPALAAAWQVELRGPTPRTLEIIPLQAQADAQPTVLCLRDVTRSQALDRMKSEFMTTAAHELRTPMASIFGFVELMRVRAMSEARRGELMEIVHRQSRRMITILDDLLDLSTLESRGRGSLQPVRLDMRALAQEVAQAHPRPEGRQAPQPPAGDDPVWVLADRGKVVRVLDNLLSNAYKYSPGGGEVTLQLVQRPGPQGGLQHGVCVQDRGLGLTAEQLQRLGERFYRADPSGNIPGTGLGVSLVREILQLHGGSLQIDSEIGVGTRCTAWLPAAP